MSPVERASWIAGHVATAVLVLPLTEELAYRGYLLRRLVAADFEGVSFAAAGWIPVLVTAALTCGILDGALWPAGMAAGIVSRCSWSARTAWERRSPRMSLPTRCSAPRCSSGTGGNSGERVPDIAAISTAAFAGNQPPPPRDGFLCWILPWFCQDNHDHGGGAPVAPEIDPASAAAALTLLAGGLAVLHGRRSGRKDS